MKQQWLVIILLVATISYSLSITSGVDKGGQDCFIITTTIGTYYYQKEAGAFSSITDLSGTDWIDYDTVNGENPSSMYRGLPSLVYSDSLGHPGFKLCTTIQIDDTTIQTTSNDGLWEWQWNFSECQAQMTITMVKSGGSYSFKYNGPPADNYGAGNYWGTDVLGYMPDSPIQGSGDTTGNWRWGYFGDSSVNRIFFISQNVKDSVPDIFRWMNGVNNDGMASFGFGYNGVTELMNLQNNRFTIGFLEQKVADSISHAQAVDAIETIIWDEPSYPLYGISVTTHWRGEGQALQGGWGNIVRHDIENDSITNHTILYSGKSTYPKINLEGTQVAFFILNDNKQGATVALMDISGDNLRKLENTKWNETAMGGFLDWPEGRWIYYLPNYGDANEIFRVHADNGNVEKVMTFKDQNGAPTFPWIWNMSADGSRMTFRATDFHIFFLTVPTTFPAEIILNPDGGTYNSPTAIYGCQHSISPSGNYICYGPPVDLHSTIRIKQWDDGSKYGCIKRLTSVEMHTWPPSQAQSGGKYHHNHWSNNSDYWICAHEGINAAYEVSNQVLYNWRDRRQVVVTTNDGSTPDFDDAGDFNIDTSNIAQLPIIRLHKTDLSFEADSGLANPDSQAVTVTNSSGGVLNDVETSIHYIAGDTAGWLTAQKNSGTGNNQIITNHIDISGLYGGNYRAVVTVSATNVLLSKIYSVFLIVDATRVFTTVLIYPEDITIEPGDTCLFTVVALDQYEDPCATQPYKWIWSTDSNATIIDGLFTSDSTKSLPYKIIATGTVDNTTLSDTVPALVELPALTVLTPDGGESYRIGDTMFIQWESSDTSKISTVALELSIDNGKTWHLLDSSAISPHNSLWGNYPWIIPDSVGIFENVIVPVSDYCKIKIRDYQFPLYRDVSDSLFTILPRPISISDEDLLNNARLFGIFQYTSRSFKIIIPPVKRYSIDVVAVNGRTIIRKRGTGSCTYTFNRHNLAAGVYIVRVRADKKRLTKRLLLY